MNKKSIFRSLVLGLKDVLQNFGSIITIVILLAIIYALAMYCYTIVMEDRGAQSLFVVISLIVLQQVFALFRLGLKTTGYASIIHVDHKN